MSANDKARAEGRAEGRTEVALRVRQTLDEFSHDGACPAGQGFDAPCDCWMSDVAPAIRAALAEVPADA